MRKLNYLALAAAAATAVSANAATFANPTYEKDGVEYSIVKWDLEKGAFAASNDFEVDETFIFAVDVTGTPLEDALKTPSRNPNVLGRGVAYDIYVDNAPEGTEGKMNIDGRLFYIKDNVYGMVLNLFQQAVTRYADAGLLPSADYSEYGALEPGYVVVYNDNIFGFGWSAENMGEEWWDAVAAPIQGQLAFETAPYTGTKTSPEFFYGDIVPADFCPFDGLDAAGFHQAVDNWGGYAPVSFADGVPGLGAAVKGIASDVETVKSVYFDLQGRAIENPAQGLYIRQDIKADGSKASVKVIL